MKSKEKLIERKSHKPGVFSIKPLKVNFRGSVPLLLPPTLLKTSSNFKDELKTRKGSDPSSATTIASSYEGKGFDFARKNLKKKPTTEILME